MAGQVQSGADPAVIQCAVTGSADADPDKRPNLPSTPDAIVASALEAWRAGAAVLPLHAREEDGTPTQSRDAFRALVDALRAEGCDAVLNLSTGTAGGRSVRDERLEPLELRPEMASFDCGTVNFGDRIFEGDVPFLRRMADAFAASGAKPELECFDSGHVGLALQLRDEGLLHDPLVVQFVLGVPASGVSATVDQVEHMRRRLPPAGRAGRATRRRARSPCRHAGPGAGNAQRGLTSSALEAGH